MKYLLLIYSNPGNWEHPMFQEDPEFLALPAGEREALTRRSEDLHREISRSGELLAGAALADPLRTRTVKVRGDLPVTTDGPYQEAKEHLAGYLMVDCETMERATEIAARIPFATVEVRPITDLHERER